MASVYDSSYTSTYSSNFITELPIISTVYLGAFQDSSKDYNLTIGASSNVILQAAAGINMYINSNSSFTLFGTSPIGTNPFPFFEVKNSNGDVYLIADNAEINFSNLAALAGGIVLSNVAPPVYSNFTDIVINGDISVDNSVTIGDTLNVSNLATFGSNITVANSATIGNNLAIGGNMFSSTMNIYTTNPNCNNTRNLKRVGYSFHINRFNQLELLRSDQLLSNSILVTKMTRVLTFGNTEFGLEKDDPNLYSVMREFAGIYGNYSNGSTPPLSGGGVGDSLWALAGSNIYYATGFVGVGTSSPTSRFHVLGTTTFEGSAEPKTDAAFSLGKSNARFKDAFVSSSVVVGTSKISVDGLGNFTFTKQNGSPALSAESVWTSSGSSLYVMNSNVGIGTSSPAYRLDVSGAVRATGYCNLLLDSYNSTSIHLAPTASNFAVAFSKVSWASNAVQATDARAAWASNTAVSASNSAFFSSNVAVFSSNTAVSASNVAIAASNSAYASTVIALAIHCIAEYGSNTSYYASNAISEASNAAYYASNAASAVASASNAAYYASNAISGASNAAYYASNAFAGVSGQSQFASNAAQFASNAADYASNAARDAFSMTSNTSNIAYAAYSYAIDANNSAIDASNAATYASNASWSTAGNKVYLLNSNVGIGTSTPTERLEVSGTVKASAGFDGPNIAKKVASNALVIGASFTKIITLSNASASNFYELNIGPSITGDPSFAKALVFLNNTTKLAHVTVLASSDIVVQASSSNIEVSAPSAPGAACAWSLYRMH